MIYSNINFETSIGCCLLRPWSSRFLWYSPHYHLTGSLLQLCGHILLLWLFNRLERRINEVVFLLYMLKQIAHEILHCFLKILLFYVQSYYLPFYVHSPFIHSFIHSFNKHSLVNWRSFMDQLLVQAWEKWEWKRQSTYPTRNTNSLVNFLQCVPCHYFWLPCLPLKFPSCYSDTPWIYNP